MKKLICCLLLLTMTFCFASCVSAEEAKRFPEFELNLFSGETLTEEIFKSADVTLVNFWATWCGPCRMEMPDFPAIIENELASVQILGVLMDDIGSHELVYQAVVATAQKIISAAALDENERYFCALPDENLAALAGQEVQYLPTTYVVSSEGEILDVVVGVRSVEEWNEILASLLKK